MGSVSQLVPVAATSLWATVKFNFKLKLYQAFKKKMVSHYFYVMIYYFLSLLGSCHMLSIHKAKNADTMNTLLFEVLQK